MKSTRYLSSLKSLRNVREKKATRGERIFGSLFPNRGTGWPGGWSSDRTEQVMHLKNWTYVAVNAICSKIAAITPNLAYVSSEAVPGKTVKGAHRGLMNLRGAGFGSGWSTGGEYNYSTQYLSSQENVTAGTGWLEKALAFAPGYERIEGSEHYTFSTGGHSFLSMGEYRSKALSVIKPHENLEPLENDHPLRRLIENPNPYDSHFDISYELQMFDELCGVDYEWLIPNKWGIPAERWCLPSHWVWPRTGGGKYVDSAHPNADELIQYYEVRPWGGMGSAGILKIPPQEIIMTRWKSPINKIDGYSRLGAGSQWIDSEESISKSRWSQFQNQARPEFWVELGPGYEDPDDNRIARLEAKFMAKIQGEYNYGKPVITPPGAKITPLSFNPTEMAYFQSEEQIRDMILSLFGVPKTAVGVSNDMTYGSLLASLAQFCSGCINPRLAMRGQTLTKHLGSRWNEPARSWATGSGLGGKGVTRHVRIWFDDCVPADPQQVNSDIQVDLGADAITPNEVRALRGRKPYAHGGDDPMTSGPGGKMPLPMNSGEDFTDLAKLVADYTKASTPEPPQEEGEEGGEEGDNPLAALMGGAGGEGGEEGGPENDLPDEEGSANPEQPEAPQPSSQEEGTVDFNLPDLAGDSAGISQPNRKPTKKSWKRINGEEYEKVVSGVRVRIVNLSRDAGYKRWNVGIVRPDGRVDWVESGSTRREVEEWIPTIVANHLRETKKGLVRKNAFEGEWVDIEYHSPSREYVVIATSDEHLYKGGFRTAWEAELWATNQGARVRNGRTKMLAVEKVSSEQLNKLLRRAENALGIGYLGLSEGRRTGRVTEVLNRSNVPTQVVADWLQDNGLRVVSQAGPRIEVKGQSPRGDSPFKGHRYEKELDAIIVTSGSLAEVMSRASELLGIPANPFPQEMLAEAAGIENPAVQEEEKPKHKYASTQVNLTDAGYDRSQGSPLEKLKALQNSIDDADLAGDGKEKELHITVKYGLHGDDPEPVRELIEGFGRMKGPINVRLGVTSIFPYDDTPTHPKEYDVVKIGVESKELTLLNGLLERGLAHTKDYPTYEPHLTLAYVKPGMGRYYVDNDAVNGLELTFDTVVFSDREGNKTKIRLIDSIDRPIEGE